MANKNTCVISVSGPLNYGYIGPSTFNNSFFESLENGKNLEDLYLEARKDWSSQDFPMISTPEGIEVQETLYPLINQFILTSDKLEDKMNVDNNVVGVCHLEEQFHRLQSFFNFIEKFNDKTSKSFSFNRELEELKQLTETYFQKQKSYLNFAIGKDLNILRTISKNNPNLTWAKILQTDYNSAIQLANEDYKKCKGYECTTIKSNIEQYKKLHAEKRQILKNHPELSDYIAEYSLFWQETKQIENLAHSISQKVPQVYHSYYERKKQELNQSNPCRDFVL